MSTSYEGNSSPGKARSHEAGAGTVSRPMSGANEGSIPSQGSIGQKASASLTLTMSELVDYMRAHGNEIHRHPGGFWAHKEWRRHDGGDWFGTRTVQAVVSRGVAAYSEHQEGRSGRFPIAARLV